MDYGGRPGITTAVDWILNIKNESADGEARGMTEDVKKKVWVRHHLVWMNYLPPFFF